MMVAWLGLVLLAIAGSAIAQDTAQSLQTQQKLQKLRQEVNNLSSRRSAQTINPIPIQYSPTSKRPIVFEIPLPPKTRRTGSEQPVVNVEASTLGVRSDTVTEKQEQTTENPTPVVSTVGNDVAESRQDDPPEEIEDRQQGEPPSLESLVEERKIKINPIVIERREEFTQSSAESRSEPIASQARSSAESKSQPILSPVRFSALSKSPPILSPARSSPELQPEPFLPVARFSSHPVSEEFLIPARSFAESRSESIDETTAAPPKSLGQTALATVVDSAILAHESNDELSRSLIALKAAQDNPRSVKSKNVALLSALKAAHLARRSNDLLSHALKSDNSENHIHPVDYNYPAERRILEQAVEELKKAQKQNEDLANAIDKTVSMSRTDYDNLRYNFPLSRAVNSGRMAQMSNYHRAGSAVKAIDLNPYLEKDTAVKEVEGDAKLSQTLSQKSRQEFGAAIQSAKQLKFGSKSRMGPV